MGKYDAQVATAARMIRDKGQGVDLVLYVDGPPDPDKPWRSEEGGEQRLSGVPAVFLNYEQKYVDGQEVHAGDQKVLIPADGLTLAPNLKGHIDRAGEVWKIVNVRPLAPDGQVIFYTLQVRQ